MTITLNTLAYNQDTQVTPDKVRYTGPANTAQVKDYIDLGRRAAKLDANGHGKTGSMVKTVKTLTLSDGTKEPMYIETNFTIPVGATAADVDAVRDAHGDFIISAQCQALVNNHDHTH